MLYALIMCGGSGKRFWPKSRKNMPKQLISFGGGKTLIQETVDRLDELIPPERIFVITNNAHTKTIKEQLKNIPEENIVGEPMSKDTALCIGYGSLLIKRRDPDAMMLVMPADHFIRPKEKLYQTIRSAQESVRNSDALFVFGIKPRYPSTAYGYIRRDKKISEVRGVSVYVVKSFHEKPNKQTATKYVESGEYFWNSGIFLWNVDSILSNIKTYTPEISYCLEEISESFSSNNKNKVIEKAYQKAPKISIDYAVMEKAKDIRMIEATYEWDDLGSWNSLEDILTKNKDGNLILGKHCGIDTNDSIIVSENQLVATIGLKNVIIVATNDTILVCHKDKSQEVRELYDKLEKEGYSQYT